MIVEHILKSKGNSVQTVVETERIAEAVRLLNDLNIGALVVVDKKGAVSGILSERDIVRRMKGDGNAVMFLSISQCMTRNPVTCVSQSSIDEVMGLMTRRRIRHLPVVEDGTLGGIISIGDVVKFKIEQVEGEAAALRDYIAS